MGLRFRKSVKVAPGVKLNVGKKSVGVSLGGKYGGVSFNSMSGARARVSAPGTGISYSTKIGNSSNGSPQYQSSSTSSGNKKGGGCLISFLKICGIILMLPFTLVFGWIAGLIWLIAFRKKMSDDNKKKKIYTIVISILSVISFLFMIICFSSSSDDPTDTMSTQVASSTEISTEEKAENDFNSEYVLDDTEPNTEYIETESEKSSEIETSSEIESEAESNPEESQDNIPNDDVVQNSENQQEQIVAVPVDEQTASQDTTTQEIQSEDTPSEEMVWVDDSASKYHKKNGCGMDNAYQVTLDQAIAMGKEPCGRCYR